VCRRRRENERCVVGCSIALCFSASGDLHAVLRHGAGDVRLGVDISSVEREEEGVVARGDEVEEHSHSVYVSSQEP
jgi:hypothetical protein